MRICSQQTCLRPLSREVIQIASSLEASRIVSDAVVTAP